MTAFAPQLLALAALAAGPADEATLDRLIAQLGAESWHKREAAAEHILRLGQRATPALERALEHADPEVRTRARALLARLRLPTPEGLPPRLTAAMRAFPSLPEVRRSAVVLEIARAVRARALPLLAEVLRHDPSASVRRTALMEMMSLDRAAAEGELRVLAAKSPVAAWARAQLGGYLARRGRIPDAIEAYESARQAGADGPDVLADLARLYEREAGWRKAAALYARLATAQPNQTDHLLKLGACHHHLGDRAKADDVWRSILVRRPGDREAYVQVAHAYRRVGEKGKMVAILREACRKHAHDFELRLQLVSALLAAGKTDEAIESYEKAARLAPTEYQRRSIRRELAQVLRRTGKLGHYIQRAEGRAAELDREITTLLRDLAQRYIAAGSHKDARRVLQRLIALYPQSADARRASERLQRLDGKD